MKLLTTKTYEGLLNKIKFLEDENKRCNERIVNAENLKNILDRLSSITINGLSFSVTGGNWNTEISLPDSVAQYADDYFGGKVIKQEATKVIEITKDGEIITGLTKQSPDKGYNYKLIRKSE